MSKHTPGPWFVAKDTDIQESDGNIVESPNGYEIRPERGIRLGNEACDLRLIAAAPELLDALFTALPFVEDAADDEIYKSHRVHVALKEIRAAIAKATGEQS